MKGIQLLLFLIIKNNKRLEKILYKIKMNNISILCKDIRIENPRSFYGCFYLGPFEENHSLTVANALRRCLLSDCLGIAIISVLIENVNHEYSTLIGVRESILDILLNLKEIVLRKTENARQIYKSYKRISPPQPPPEPPSPPSPPPSVPPPSGGVTALLSGFTGAKPPQGQSPRGLGVREASLPHPHVTASLLLSGFTGVREASLPHLPEGRSPGDGAPPQNPFALPKSPPKVGTGQSPGGWGALLPTGFGGGTVKKGGGSGGVLVSISRDDQQTTRDHEPAYDSSLYEKVGKSFFKPVIGYLKMKGPGIIRAKDLRLPPFIKCVDPNQYIATLSEDGFLNMKFVIMEGKGYIIQKSTPIIDQNFVKKRQKLLNHLKNLYTNSRSNTHSQIVPFLKESSKSSQGTFRTLGEKITEFSLKDNIFNNATSLNIDAVFNSVTKVSYTIEISENHLVDHENNKTVFIDKISSLFESGLFLKKTFPFLTTISEDRMGGEAPAPKLLGGGRPVGPLAPKPPGQSQSPGGLGGLGTQDQGSYNHFKDLINYVDSFGQISKDVDFQCTYRSLYPFSLIKKNSLHTLVIEIWTNGSLHPREALSLAFCKLSSLFLKLESIKIWSQFYKDSSSYKKSLILLK